MSIPEEMKGFARQWIEPQLQFSVILFIVILHVATLLGVILGVSLDSWIAGVATGAGSFFLITTFLYIVYWGTERLIFFFLQNCSTISISDLQCIDSIGTGRTTLAWLWLEN